MKIHLLLICYLLLLRQTWAQSEKGLLIDADDQKPIVGAYIFGLDTLLSDSNGQFTYTIGHLLRIQSLGYLDQTIQPKSPDLVIKLVIDPILMSAITVNSMGIPQSFQSYPGSISMISKERIENTDPTLITGVLNEIPGIYMQSGSLNTNKIIIRGIGARSAFATNKIRAYYQDIPLTNGNGETTLEDIDLNAIGRVEIIKGPNSSIYGSGLGGTINISPKNTLLGTHYLENRLTTGSFGLLKSGITYGLHQDRFKSLITFNRQTSDGYRDNNTFSRNSLLTTQSFYQSKNTFSLLTYFVKQNAGIPSSLNEYDYLQTPTSAAYTWAQSQGYEDYDKLLIGASWIHTYNPLLIQHTSLYTSIYDGFEARPFNILEDKVWGFGFRSRWVKTFDHVSHILMAGIETYRDAYDWQTFANLYQNTPGQGSIQGNLVSDNEEIRRYYNLFIEANLKPRPEASLDIGLNLNQTHYSYIDTYELDSIDNSGGHGFNPIISPRIGFSYAFDPHTTSFAVISHGFSPPSVEETLTPDGNINPEIQPETGWNFEWGLKGTVLKNRLRYTTSLYQMNIQNLLVAKRTALDQYIGLNAGSTVHRGIELSLNHQLISSDYWDALAVFNYNHAAYKFKEFLDADMDHSGNQLTGVPTNQISFSFIGNFKKWIYTELMYQYVDKMPLKDDNSLYSDGYQVVNFQVGLNSTIGHHMNFYISYRVNNVLDAHYAAMHQINASGFGGTAPRFYYPGLPRNQLISLKIKFEL